ncbi:hypothetical protein [Sulfurisphaera ohwakuensis]|uniref:hypothetical protein n=1 Tax=Sulfurisphaera ohwakuensis TaxID=69656 RepID=UPI0036F1DB33
MIDLQTLVNYLAYFGWIAVFAGIIASAILIALGRTAEGKKIIFGTAAGAFILAFGWTIITSVIPSQSYDIPGWNEISYVIYAAAAFSTIFAAIELIRGNGREGLGYFLTAIALIFILNYGPTIFGVNNVSLTPPQVNAVFGIGIPGTSFQLGVPVQWLIDMPNAKQITSINVDGQAVYQFVENIAFGVLTIALLGDIIWTLWQKEDVFETLKDTAKDAAAAVLLIVAMPSIYQIFATVINYIANSLIQPVAGTITTMGDAAAALIGAGFAGGFFVPALADIASDILFSLAIAGMLAAIRFFAIAAALILFPIFMALWVFPPLRGAVKFLVEFVLGMAFSGIIAAGLFLTLLSIGTSNAGYAAILYLASPVLYGFLPMMISFVGGSGLLSLGTNILPFKRGRGGRGSKQTQQSGGATPVPVPVPAGGGINAQGSVGQTKLRIGRRQSGGSVALPQTQIQVSNPPAPINIIDRLRNRRTITITGNPQEIGKTADRLKGMKREVDYVTPVSSDKLKQYGEEMRQLAQNFPAMPAELRSSILRKMGEEKAKELGISQRIRTVVYRETVGHALKEGISKNVKAGTVMTAQKFGQKMDDWLNAQGISIRPFESIENKIKEVRLRKQGRQIKQTR